MNGRSGRKMKDIGLFRQLSPRLRLTLIWMLSRSQYIPPSPRFRLSAIVNRMPDHIHRYGNEYYVCNPEDNGENFAEKWNRPDEGYKYVDAFNKWHASARSALTLGLDSHASTETFAKAVQSSSVLVRHSFAKLTRAFRQTGRCPGGKTV